MGKIHVNRDRRNLGQFTPEEIAEGLVSGRFIPADLAWREGMEAWQPLSTFTDLPAAEVETPPLPTPPDEPPAPEIPAGPPKPDWERQAEIGFLRAGLGTIVQVFTQPITTFRDLKKTGGFPVPLTFSFCVGFACGLVGILELLVWVQVLPASMLPKNFGSNPARTVLDNLAVTIPFMIAIGVLGPFVFSGIYHAMIRLLTKKTVAYETVFRTYCYTVGALSIINLLPIPPIEIAQIPYLIFLVIIAVTYQVIALREACKLTNMEAACVVLLPLVMVCFCGVAIVGGFMAMAGALPSMQSMGR